MANSRERRKLRRTGLPIPFGLPQPEFPKKKPPRSSRKAELRIDVPVALLIFLLPWGADQMGLAHSFWLGLASWVIGIGIAIRILWILPWRIQRPQLWKAAASLTILLLLIRILWHPVRQAYRNRYASTISNAHKPQSFQAVPPLPLARPNGTILDDIQIENFGTGLKNDGSAPINIENSKIHDNGIGIENDDPNAHLNIRDTDISHNRKGIVNKDQSGKKSN